MSNKLIRGWQASSPIIRFGRNASRNLSQTGAGYKWAPRCSLTKIVATIGPASENMPTLEHVVEAGMRVMRINFSHATYDEANLRSTNLKLCRGVHNYGIGEDFNLRAVMLDTQGPEIRTGSFEDNSKVQLEIGNEVILSNNNTFRYKQTPERLWVSYSKISTAVKNNTQILLDDGAIELRVEKVVGEDVFCKIMNTGTLGNKKGVNMPGETVDLPAMCEKDMEDIKWGVMNDVDYIAASFTRKAQDVHDIRDYIKSLMSTYHPPNHPLPKIISKIESTEALVNFQEILDVSDGIMVARGDLGVEIPMQTLAYVQKELVRKSNQAGKPVVVATQMLDSMQKNPRPTRAECTDVANAILDGADCVMLSGESAQGKYPVQSVKMMQNIIDETEVWAHSQGTALQGKHTPDGEAETFGASVVAASKHLGVSCIIVLCQSGSTAIDISKFKPAVPVVCLVDNQKAGRLLQIYRGLHPITSPKELKDGNAHIAAITYAKSMGFCTSTDRVLVVSKDNSNTVAELGLVRVEIHHLSNDTFVRSNEVTQFVVAPGNISLVRLLLILNFILDEDSPENVSSSIINDILSCNVLVMHLYGYILLTILMWNERRKCGVVHTNNDLTVGITKTIQERRLLESHFSRQFHTQIPTPSTITISQFKNQIKTIQFKPAGIVDPAIDKEVLRKLARQKNVRRSQQQAIVWAVAIIIAIFSVYLIHPWIEFLPIAFLHAFVLILVLMMLQFLLGPKEIALENWMQNFRAHGPTRIEAMAARGGMDGIESKTTAGTSFNRQMPLRSPKTVPIVGDSLHRNPNNFNPDVQQTLTDLTGQGSKQSDDTSATNYGRTAQQLFKEELSPYGVSKSPSASTSFTSPQYLPISWNTPAPYPISPTTPSSFHMPHLIESFSPSQASTRRSYIPSPLSTRHVQTPLSPISNTKFNLIGKDITSIIDTNRLSEMYVDNLRRILGQHIKESLYRFDYLIGRILEGLMAFGLAPDVMKKASQLLTISVEGFPSSLSSTNTTASFSSLSELLHQCKQQVTLAASRGMQAHSLPFTDPQHGYTDVLTEYLSVLGLFSIHTVSQSMNTNTSSFTSGIGSSGTTDNSSNMMGNTAAATATGMLLGGGSGVSQSMSFSSSTDLAVTPYVMSRLRLLGSDGFLGAMIWKGYAESRWSSSGSSSAGLQSPSSYSTSNAVSVAPISDQDIVMSVFLNYCDSNYRDKNYMDGRSVGESPQPTPIKRPCPSVSIIRRPQTMQLIAQSPIHGQSQSLTPSENQALKKLYSPHFNILYNEPPFVEFQTMQGRFNCFQSILILLVLLHKNYSSRDSQNTAQNNNSLLTDNFPMRELLFDIFEAEVTLKYLLYSIVSSYTSSSFSSGTTWFPQPFCLYAICLFKFLQTLSVLMKNKSLLFDVYRSLMITRLPLLFQSQWAYFISTWSSAYSMYHNLFFNKKRVLLEQELKVPYGGQERILSTRCCSTVLRLRNVRGAPATRVAWISQLATLETFDFLQLKEYASHAPKSQGIQKKLFSKLEEHRL
eukprot:gene5781-11681_t